MADGLYDRVCMRRGIPHVKAEEDAWVEDVYSFYGDAATEELDCVPSQGGGAYFSLALIESRTSRDVPVVRYKCAQGYETTAEHTRLAKQKSGASARLGPLLADLPKEVAVVLRHGLRPLR
ncbi:hypothetical protein NWF32_17160 [Pseudomonas qingdaonensis]|nr:hypothetical protein [Pseudomonas qingdaonensis]